MFLGAFNLCMGKWNVPIKHLVKFTTHVVRSLGLIDFPQQCSFVKLTAFVFSLEVILEWPDSLEREPTVCQLEVAGFEKKIKPRIRNYQLTPVTYCWGKIWPIESKTLKMKGSSFYWISRKTSETRQFC